MSWGGARKNAGRKSKADELKLIEKLSPLQDTCFEAIRNGIESNDFRYVKLYMNYMYGKPKQLELYHEEDNEINKIVLEIVE